MKKFLKQVEITRSDLSSWLVHFIKGSPKYAPQTVDSILANGLKNHGKGLCFTESPLLGFSALLDDMASKYPDRPLYSHYGIAVRKKWFFERGGRPVIYLPEKEYEHLKEPLRYLWEKYEPGDADFTWLREWRSNGDLLELPKEDAVLVVPTEKDGERFYEIEADGEYEGPGEFSTFAVKVFDWHYVSIERIRSLAAQRGGTTDSILSSLLDEQGRESPED